jgi:hypothetical protein
MGVQFVFTFRTIRELSETFQILHCARDQPVENVDKNANSHV